MTNTEFIKATLTTEYDNLDIQHKGLLAAALCIDVDDHEDVLPVDKIKAGQESFIASIQNIKKDYVTNWHHTQTAEALEKVRTGEIKRLLILEPPRHGKSEQVSRQFPARCLGMNKHEKIIACSYSADLASMMGLDVQRNMATPEFKAMYETRLAGDLASTGPNTLGGKIEGVHTKDKVKRQERFFEVANGDGYYIGAGIGGPITGKGFTLGIIDDPIKNKEEAMSQTIRDKVWSWYNSTFLTRGEGAASIGGEERIVICMTPWHEDDLSGRILKQAKENEEEWVVIRFEAVKEKAPSADNLYKSTPEYSHDPREIGEALWPDKFNKEKLKKIETRDAHTWDSLYQCRPSKEEGNVFKAADFQYYESVSDLPRFDTKCFTVDAAFKDLVTSSYVVIQHWGLKGPDRYLLQQWRDRMDYPKTRELLRKIFLENSSTITKLIEEKANGAALIAELRKIVPGIVPVTPKDSKYLRALAAEGYVSGGNVFLPRFLSCSASLVAEAKAFPYGPHDDQVDAMVQMLLHYQYNAVAYLRKLTAVS